VPHSAEAYYVRAIYYDKVGNTYLAQQDATIAVSLNPEHVKAKNLLDKLILYFTTKEHIVLSAENLQQIL